MKISSSADKDKDSSYTLEKLHDLAVNMARDKRHQILDRHYSAIETVASAQDTWRNFIEPPFSRISSGRISHKASVTFADERDENDVENSDSLIVNGILNHDKHRPLGKYRSSGPVRRRASDRELEELKRNRDDTDIDMKKDRLGRSRFATFGGTLPGGDQAVLVR